MEDVTECQSFADFESLQETVEAAMGGPVMVVSSKTVDVANKDLADGEAKFPAILKYKNVRLGCKQFGYRTEGKNIRATHSPVKLQCPAHVIAVADKEQGVLVIKQVSLEHNHQVSSDSSAFKAELLLEDPHVSNLGSTVTVSCKDQSTSLEDSCLGGALLDHLKSDVVSLVPANAEHGEDDSDEEEDSDDKGGEGDTDSSECSQPKKPRPTPSKKAKRPSSKYYKYSADNLKQAYDAVKLRGFTVHAASQLYQIPKSTLYDRINQRSVYNLAEKPNRLKTKILDEETERQIVNHIVQMESSERTLNMGEILALATNMAHAAGTIKKEKSLSRGWFKAFQQRWPVVRSPSASANTSERESDLPRKPRSKQEYYVVLKSLIDKHKFSSKPFFIYKIDEVIFHGTGSRKSSNAGPQPQKRKIFDKSGNCVTVLLCGNAIGFTLPPYFTFKKKKNVDMTQGCMDGSRFKPCESGLLTVDGLKEFLNKHFIPSLVKKEDEKVLLLYEDFGHIVCQNLVEWAWSHGVILYTMPTHHSDSVDFGCFYTFSQVFSSVCKEFLRSHQKINTPNLPHLVYLTMIRSLTVRNVRGSFSQAGIFPFDMARKELMLARTLTESSESENARKRKTRTSNSLSPRRKKARA